MLHEVDKYQNYIMKIEPNLTLDHAVIVTMDTVVIMKPILDQINEVPSNF